MPLPTPTLQTARLRLRPFAPSDTAAIFALQSNALVLRYWDSSPWTEPVQAERFIVSCKQMEEAGNGARLVIERNADTAFIGWCCLTHWNPAFRSAKLGYCLGEAAWGRGFATEAADALLRWAFDALDLNRVQAESDTRNRASSRVLEKLGFVREGTLREDCVVDGVTSDSWVYGLLRRRWMSRPACGPVLAAAAPMLEPEAPATVRILERRDVKALRDMQSLFARALDDADASRAAESDDDCLERLLDNEAFVAIAAFAADEVVGGLTGYVLPKCEGERSEFYLYDLAVEEGHRRLGIATAMIEQVRDAASGRGFGAIFVQADRGDEPAIALYSRLGVGVDVVHFDLEPSAKGIHV